MIVTKNTYPEYDKVPHAEAGDIVDWITTKGCYRLVKTETMADNNPVVYYATPPIDQDCNLKSTGRPPVLVGIIAQVKSKGWVLEVQNEN